MLYRTATAHRTDAKQCLNPAAHRAGQTSFERPFEKERPTNSACDQRMFDHVGLMRFFRHHLIDHIPILKRRERNRNPGDQVCVLIRKLYRFFCETCFIDEYSGIINPWHTNALGGVLLVEGV